MQRCRHKKSRKGCFECKRRHIRCDEGRPICRNCITAQRKCEYGRPNGSAPNVDSQLPSSTTPGFVPGPEVPQVTGVDNQYLTTATNVNMHHMELLLHFSFAIYAPEMDEHDSATRLVLQAALTSQYLMLVVLALSARHLSTIRRGRSDWYLHQAVELQTMAIELFNSTSTDDSQDDTLTRLLFSSIIGRHILVDAFLSRDVEFSQFLSRFIQGIRVHRGTRAVTAAQGWEMLLNSEIGPLMAKGMDPLGFHSLPPLSPHFEVLISRAAGLGADAKVACDTSLRMIEAALGDLDLPERSSYGVRMIFVWPILLPVEFISLLEQQVPEAIAILGRYAILLHAGRELWQIKDAGSYILNHVSVCLGPGWDIWF
ncbi:hypothetical protein NCS52_01312600 [Fusarium sp. LHS14.1]|nr:hypothetical protein NCS52_01312600 [Fusarium sp. LHS14.1]